MAVARTLKNPHSVNGTIVPQISDEVIEINSYNMTSGSDVTPATYFIYIIVFMRL